MLHRDGGELFLPVHRSLGGSEGAAPRLVPSASSEGDLLIAERTTPSTRSAGGTTPKQPLPTTSAGFPAAPRPCASPISTAALPSPTAHLRHTQVSSLTAQPACGGAKRTAGGAKKRLYRRFHMGITSGLDLHRLASCEDEGGAEVGTAPAPSSSSCEPPPSLILDFLYLGGVSDARNAEFLARENITTILNISTEEYWCPFNGIAVHSFPISDWGTEDIATLFRSTRYILDKVRARFFAEKQTKEEQHAAEPDASSSSSPPRVLVHCQKGRSRSATIVAAYLMYRNGWSAEQSLTFLRQRRRCVEPNIGFLNALRVFQDEMMPREKRNRRFQQLSVVVRNIAGPHVTEAVVREFFEKHVGPVREVVIHRRQRTQKVAAPAETGHKAHCSAQVAEECTDDSNSNTVRSMTELERSVTDIASHSATSIESVPTTNSTKGRQEARGSCETNNPLTLCLVYFACYEHIQLAESLAATGQALLQSTLGGCKEIKIKASLRVCTQQQQRRVSDPEMQ